MSQVKMISIDLMSAPEGKSDLSKSDLANSENSGFSRLVDQQILQDKNNASARQDIKPRVENESSEASPAQTTVETKENHTQDDVDTAVENEVDVNSQQENKEVQSGKEYIESKVENKESAATQSEHVENESVDKKPQALIDLLAKSDMLLKQSITVKNENSDTDGTDQGGHDGKATLAADKSSSRGEKSADVIQKVIDADLPTVDSKASTSDSTARDKSEIAQQLSNKSGEIQLTSEQLESLGDKELAKNAEQVSVKHEVNSPIDRTQVIEHVTKGQVPSNNTNERLSQEQLSEIEQLAAEQNVSDVDFAAKQTTLDNSQLNSPSSSDRKTPQVNAAHVYSSQDNNAQSVANALANHEEQRKTLASDSIELTSVTEQVASTRLPTQEQQSRFDVSKIHQAVSQATSTGGSSANSQMNENGANDEQANKHDGLTEQQFMATKESSPVQSERAVRSTFAETLAATAGASTIVNDNVVDQKALQQQLDNIASRVVESNQVAAKTQQAQLETINIYRRDFANAVKDKVMVMVSQKLQQVDIQLDPPELGNVHVRLNLQGEQALVNFTVQNQQAKDAFEQQMGKLKEMLQDSGVDVGDANVAQQGHQSEGEQQAGMNSGNSFSQGEESDNVVEMSQLVKPSATGIDFYA